MNKTLEKLRHFRACPESIDYVEDAGDCDSLTLLRGARAELVVWLAEKVLPPTDRRHIRAASACARAVLHKAKPKDVTVLTSTLDIVDRLCAGGDVLVDELRAARGAAEAAPDRTPEVPTMNRRLDRDGDAELVASVEKYDATARNWLNAKGRHYLNNAPPGAIFMIACRWRVEGLYEDVPVGGPICGMCVVGRPVARRLPQDGSVGEVTRFVLEGCPHGTASWLLLCAAMVARDRRMRMLISYHDRTRHTGCIYRKVGFRKGHKTDPHGGVGWASRSGREASAESGRTSKRRWEMALSEVPT